MHQYSDWQNWRHTVDTYSTSTAWSKTNKKRTYRKQIARQQCTQSNNSKCSGWGGEVREEEAYGTPVAAAVTGSSPGSFSRERNICDTLGRGADAEIGGW